MSVFDQAFFKKIGIRPAPAPLVEFEDEEEVEPQENDPRAEDPLPQALPPQDAAEPMDVGAPTENQDNNLEVENQDQEDVSDLREGSRLRGESGLYTSRLSEDSQRSADKAPVAAGQMPNMLPGAHDLSLDQTRHHTIMEEEPLADVSHVSPVPVEPEVAEDIPTPPPLAAGAERTFSERSSVESISSEDRFTENAFLDVVQALAAEDGEATFDGVAKKMRKKRAVAIAFRALLGLEAEGKVRTEQGQVFDADIVIMVV